MRKSQNKIPFQRIYEEIEEDRYKATAFVVFLLVCSFLGLALTSCKSKTLEAAKEYGKTLDAKAAKVIEKKKESLKGE